MTFCSRMFHQSIVSQDTLYVDGGEIRRYENLSESPIAVIPSTVDTIDLSKRWSNAENDIWAHISKNISTSQVHPSSMNDGAIYSNGSSLWLYGGGTTRAKDSTPPPNGIWRYDIKTDEWSQPSTGGDSVQRLVRGSSTQLGSTKGFFLGGIRGPATDPVEWSKDRTKPHYFTQGLIIFDESTQSFKNVSTTGLDAQGTVANGILITIESLGSQGILVAFGGAIDIPGRSWHFFGTDIPDNGIQWPMENISVYDIAHERWYQQEATGDIPSKRNNGCSIVVGAEDQSSFSIYLFGGSGVRWSGNNDGNVYVLSIPSFKWIRVTDDADLRWRHQCHLMGKNHMLVVGGQTPGDDDDDVLSLGSSGCDNKPKFSQGLGMFSLNDHVWSTSYDPVVAAAPYQIHPSISKVIGGGTSGGAIIRKPDKGFSSEGLRDLLGVESQNSSEASLPTPPTATAETSLTSDPRTSEVLGPGSIAGIAVGAISVAILGLGLLWLRYRRLRSDLRPVEDINSVERRVPVISEPQPALEIDGGSIRPEVHGGQVEDSLARMYRSEELSDAAEIYEMPPPVPPKYELSA
ncbi:MAG: hypothetical protein Q9216_004623 [Gyalolechia sp. 2 TL-2023]